MGQGSEEMIKQAQNQPKDEFGVTYEDILFYKEEDKLLCLLEAPDKEAVRKHHERLGITCEWITEAKMNLWFG